MNLEIKTNKWVSSQVVETSYPDRTVPASSCCACAIFLKVWCRGRAKPALHWSYLRTCSSHVLATTRATRFGRAALAGSHSLDRNEADETLSAHHQHCRLRLVVAPFGVLLIREECRFMSCSVKWTWIVASWSALRASFSCKYVQGAIFREETSRCRSAVREWRPCRIWWDLPNSAMIFCAWKCKKKPVKKTLVGPGMPCSTVGCVSSAGSCVLERPSVWSASSTPEQEASPEWRDSDVGESCSDHDCSMADPCCAALASCSFGGSRVGHSHSSCSEDDEDYVVFGDSPRSDILLDNNSCDTDGHSTPVAGSQARSFGMSLSEWTDESEDDFDANDFDGGQELLAEFQPRCIPFSSSYCRSVSDNRTTSTATAAAQSTEEDRVTLTDMVCPVKFSSPFHRSCVCREDAQTSPPAGERRVRFQSSAKLVQVRFMYTWTFASQAVRRGPWGRDRSWSSALRRTCEEIWRRV